MAWLAAAAPYIAAGGSAGAGIGSVLLGQDPKLPSLDDPTGREKELRNALVQMLREGRGQVEAGVGQQQLLLPEILRTIGQEATFTRRDEGLSDLLTQRDELAAQANELATLDRRGRRARRRVGGRPKRERKELERQIRRLDRQIGDIRARPLDITGIEGDPDASPYSRIVNQLLGRIEGGLSGEATNPALEQVIDRRRDSLMARLAQRLGPGFAGSSAGHGALADFEREMQLFREQQIGTSLAGLGNMQGAQAARIGLLAAPGAMSIEGGQGLGQFAGNFNDILQLLQRERALDASMPVPQPSNELSDILGAASGGFSSLIGPLFIDKWMKGAGGGGGSSQPIGNVGGGQYSVAKGIDTTPRWMQ